MHWGFSCSACSGPNAFSIIFTTNWKSWRISKKDTIIFAIKCQNSILEWIHMVEQTNGKHSPVDEFSTGPDWHNFNKYSGYTFSIPFCFTTTVKKCLVAFKGKDLYFQKGMMRENGCKRIAVIYMNKKNTQFYIPSALFHGMKKEETFQPPFFCLIACFCSFKLASLDWSCW